MAHQSTRFNIGFAAALLLLLVASSCKRPSPTEQYCALSDSITASGSGLRTTTDIARAQQCATISNKPMMLLFTGYANGSTRDHDRALLENPAVYALLKEHFVVAELFVDDRHKLPAPDTVWVGNRFRIATKIGHINAAVQELAFYSNAQPLWVVADATLKPLAAPLSAMRSDKAPLLANMLKTGLTNVTQLPDSLRTLEYFAPN